MPNFTYQARNETGELVTGKLTALNEEQLLDQLSREGLYVTKVRKQRTAGTGDIHIERITRGDVHKFTLQLLPVVRSGVPLVAGLKTLEETLTKHRMKAAVNDIVRDLQNGLPMSSAMERRPEIFSTAYCSAIRAGEQTGQLPQVLQHLADILGWQEKLGRTMRQMSLYPLLAFGGLLIFNFVLATKTIPAFERVLKQIGLKVTLPLPTRIVTGYSAFLTEWWPLLLLILLLSIAGFALLLNNPKPRYFVDQMMLKIPIIGRMIRLMAFARFARFLSLLLGSGMNVLDSIRASSTIVTNSHLRAVFDRVHDRVANGVAMSQAFRETGECPALVIQMVSVGELSGDMESALKNVTSFFETEVDHRVQQMFTLFTPIIVTVLATCILFLALAFYLPLFRMIEYMQTK